MKKPLLIFTVFTFLFSFLGCEQPANETEASAADYLTFISYTVTEDRLGGIRVYGEIENTGEQDLASPGFNVNLLDNSNNILDTSFGSVTAEVIPAGKIYGFSTWFMDTQVSLSSISEVSFTNFVTEFREENFEVGSSISNISVTTPLGDVEVEGTFTNTLEENLKYVNVYAIFHDVSGKIISYNYASINGIISSGDSESFKILTDLIPDSNYTDSGIVLYATGYPE